MEGSHNSRFGNSKNRSSEQKDEATLHIYTILEGIPDGTEIYYTDGSSNPNPGPAGAGCVVCCKGATVNNCSLISVAIGQGSNNIAEMWAIGVSLQVIGDRLASQKSFAGPTHIFTDSKFSLNILEANHRVKRHKNPSYRNLLLWTIARKVKQILREIRRNLNVVFHWTPGHADIKGNELADNAADAASQANSHLPTPDLWSSINNGDFLLKSGYTPKRHSYQTWDDEFPCPIVFFSHRGTAGDQNRNTSPSVSSSSNPPPLSSAPHTLPLPPTSPLPHTPSLPTGLPFPTLSSLTRPLKNRGNKKNDGEKKKTVFFFAGTSLINDLTHQEVWTRKHLFFLTDELHFWLHSFFWQHQSVTNRLLTGLRNNNIKPCMFTLTFPTKIKRESIAGNKKYS